MEKLTVKITWFNTSEQKAIADRVKAEKGLKEFNTLDIQWKGRPAEGLHVIDTKHMFDNQYNTVSDFRIFEYCAKLDIHVRPLTEGYYISEGIEKIREYQQRITQCCYCGNQEIDSKKEWCDKCRGSEYLKENDYPLTKMFPLLQKKRVYTTPPDEVLEDIKKQQYSARMARLEQDKKDRENRLKKEIQDKEKEYKAFQWLIKNDIDFENVIYYSHTDTFCFGWRESVIGTGEKELVEKLDKFPYQWELK